MTYKCSQIFCGKLAMFAYHRPGSNDVLFCCSSHVQQAAEGAGLNIDFIPIDGFHRQLSKLLFGDEQLRSEQEIMEQIKALLDFRSRIKEAMIEDDHY